MFSSHFASFLLVFLGFDDSLASSRLLLLCVPVSVKCIEKVKKVLDSSVEKVKNIGFFR